MTWTVWWWDERDSDHMPVPMSRRFDTKREAVEYARDMTEDPPEWLGWVKAFRSDNEGYVAYRWHRSAGPSRRRPLDPLDPPRGRTTSAGLMIVGGLFVAALLVLTLINIFLIHT